MRTEALWFPVCLCREHTQKHIQRNTQSQTYTHTLTRPWSVIQKVCQCWQETENLCPLALYRTEYLPRPGKGNQLSSLHGKFYRAVALFLPAERKWIGLPSGGRRWRRLKRRVLCVFIQHLLVNNFIRFCCRRETNTPRLYCVYVRVCDWDGTQTHTCSNPTLPLAKLF